MASGLPPNHRYITTHNADGKSVYVGSSEQNYRPAGGTGFMARSYAVSNVPAVLANDADIEAYNAGPESVSSSQRREIVMPTEGGKYNGANLLVVDIVPGGWSQLHRTTSIDYSICCIGEIIHELDSGERVTLKPGDHIVQRGTNHRWINASKTEPARFVAVALPCEPFAIADKPMQESWTSDEKDYRPNL